MRPDVPPFVCFGGIFLDDIVYPDGRTSMGVLGGGGVHCAAGAAVWGDAPALIATAGTDLPPEIRQRLDATFDTRGIVKIDLPQVRAWQIFEWDGLRRELVRVKHVYPFIDGEHLSPIPEPYHHTPAVAILHWGKGFLRWREQFPNSLVIWEPDQHFMKAENAPLFRSALQHCHIVSPNLVESEIIYGTDDPDALIDHMLADGAPAVALRMGERGSIVANAQARYPIPALDVPQVVDVTGAGNSYVGGLLVGYARTRDIRMAGIYGAVSASFTVEVVGVPPVPPLVEVEKRLSLALSL